jgi:hypothetical protein
MAAKASQDRYKTVSISASTAVKATPGVLHRILVTASSSGILKVYDSTAASGTVVIANLSVAAKDNFELNIQCGTGIYVELVSGTATWSVMYV